LKKLDLYLLRELIVPFLIGTVAVVLMFQANTLIFQLKTFSVATVPATAMVQYILYKTPSFLVMTLVVGTSLAASLAVSRLVRESELTAMRAAGASILRVLLPITFFGLFVAACNFVISEKLMPRSEKASQELLMQIGLLGAMPEFKSNVLINLSHYSASFGTVARNADGSVKLGDVMLIERPRPGEMMLILSDSGSYRDGVWTMHNTYVWRIEGLKLYAVKSGKKDLVINERVTVESIFAQPIPEQESLETLGKVIREAKARGDDTTWLEITYHTRFSVPAACIVFALVAPVFAVWLGKGGGFTGVLLSIFLVFLYFNAYVISTEILGRNGYVNPFIAAWLPNFLFILMGVLAVRRLE
jgi:lipopolysaccharide export system permease protein